VFDRNRLILALKQRFVWIMLLILAVVMVIGASAFLPMMISDATVTEQISPEMLLTQLETAERAAGKAPLILDVRSVAEYNHSHIPGALNIPHRDLPHRLNELSAFKAQPIVLYCEAGVRARIAETTLVEAGFQQVVHLTGDMQEWRRKAFPVESRSIFP
jgi:phage shock protein E